MLQFTYSSYINAPVKTVWEFHERPDILQRLTPPWQPVRVVRRQGGLGVGAISEFLLFLGPFPVRWLARHTQCQAYELFVDEQAIGPMEYWQHSHQFAPEGGGTRLTDAIAFALPGGWFSEALLGGFVKTRLEEMFRYRHTVTQQECEPN